MVLKKEDATALLDDETKYVVAGHHAFRAVDHEHLHNLGQRLINIGAKYGKVDIHDIFYGRNSVTSNAEHRFETSTTALKGCISMSHNIS